MNVDDIYKQFLILNLNPCQLSAYSNHSLIFGTNLLKLAFLCIVFRSLKKINKMDDKFLPLFLEGALLNTKNKHINYKAMEPNPNPPLVM